VATIHENLTASAKRYALVAADAYVTRNYAACSLAAGIAVEHALKARLAAETPVLLAFGRSDPGWFKSARALWTYRDDADAFAAESTEVQTVAASQALDRALELDPRLRPLRSHADRVFRCRNSEAHMGLAGSEEMQAVFASCAKAMNDILGLGNEFWGDHADLVDSLLDRLASALRQRVQEKLAAARREFDRRFGNEPEEIRNGMLSLISNTRDWHVAPEALPYDCPACGSPALVEGTNSVETDWDTHTDVPSETVWLEATRLTCEACHLVLEGSEELEAAGIDPVMENEGIDAGDVYRDFEPDEDWFRDR
jgi:hypothetical protein